MGSQLESRRMYREELEELNGIINNEVLLALGALEELSVLRKMKYK